jgi:hypothetical protein
MLDMTIAQAPRDLLAPLFDPQMVRMTNSQIDAARLPTPRLAPRCTMRSAGHCARPQT